MDHPSSLRTLQGFQSLATLPRVCLSLALLPAITRLQVELGRMGKGLIRGHKGAASH
jgi:hypothetical protein